ncbi:EAL domain-containing protein [Solirubrobacter phytolaccae]|uniref:EAL domain-containing protein n=1 Tax=Solirubrobacter phytolaccae TaxID=1404360 RepID=A0A9X3N679_9ACTN|nr:EAL domain-containing protein [Solirubrobacter phytolaccae]MDA0180374.1 EAL domain-containing protein [Solirubrobacter phytolaccae]
MVEAVMADPDGIRIVAQPIVDLVTGRIVGHEALSRFDRRLGWGPQQWFGCAHACGLGARLEAAAIDAALCVPDRPAGTYLTVNVSPSTLGTRALGEVLPCDLSGLVFELTENESISADPTLPATLRGYRRRGAQFALDDVGSGHARLADIALLAPELVKLDRSLITSLDDDPARASAVEELVHAALSTGAQVCAEGVETLQQLRWLHRAGVTHVQGYLLGRPHTGWAADSPALDGLVQQARTPALLNRFQTPSPQRHDRFRGGPSSWTGRKPWRLIAAS